MPESKKKKPSVPPVSRRRRAAVPVEAAVHALRSHTPAAPRPSVGLVLSDTTALLGAEAKAARDQALDAMATRRREAEARAGSVKLS